LKIEPGVDRKDYDFLSGGEDTLSREY